MHDYNIYEQRYIPTTPTISRIIAYIMHVRTYTIEANRTPQACTGAIRLHHRCEDGYADKTKQNMTRNARLSTEKE